MDEPLVSIMMPTMNRCTDLRETIAHLYEQQYKNIEIVVIDNGSTDGTREMIEREFPQVKYIRMPRNVGAIAGRNIGFANCRGKYILHLDDDSFPGNYCIMRMVEEFEKDSRLGLVACRVRDYWQLWQPNGWTSVTQEPAISGSPTVREVTNWIGCGGGIRRELRDKIGYYEEWGLEAMFERTFSVRILNEGYAIKAFSDIYVYHHWSANGEPAACRLAPEAMFTGCRSTVLFYLKYFPIQSMLYNLWRLTYNSVFACLEQRTTLYLRALFSAAKMAPAVWRERQKISYEVLSRFHIPFNFKGK